ncbi:MAG: hypothetical protein MJZ22_05515 [Candidatus Saccharibacteria bacterium]|nr:hypothetical protein [Candidatus Saccharibacteria bacterium]
MGKKVYFCSAKLQKRKNMPELLFQPKTKIQLAWLLNLAQTHDIPYREYVCPTVTKSASKQALLQEITKAGAQAMKIARGEKKGRNAYDLLNEL